MLKNDNIQSLKRPLFYLNTILFLIVVLCSIIILATIFVQQAKNQLSDNVRNWADLVSVQAETLINKYSADNISSQKELSTFSQIPMINFVYI